MRIVDLKPNEINRSYDLYKSINFDIVICDNVKDVALHMKCEQREVKVKYKKYIVINDNDRKACICDT